MILHPKRSSILIIFFMLSITALASGCLNDSDDEGEEGGVSAISLRATARQERDHQPGDLELVVVTAMDPTSEGRALSWKFAYNDVTSGIPLSSFQVTIGADGEAAAENGDPLQKTRIRNWSLDSTRAYSKARDQLIGEGIISSNTGISVRFLYLLGEDNQNGGCEWIVGLILGSEEPFEATVRVDGSNGEILEIISSKT